jgi:ComF family protein
VLAAALELLLPARCGGCDAIGDLFCGRCRSASRELQEPLCPRCGAEVESVRRRDCGCGRRLRHLARIRSCAAYEGSLERALHRFKYRGRRALAGPLALLLAERLAVDGLAGEAIAWVPLGAARRRARGYNQAELLARALAGLTGVPSLPGSLLRLRETPPQVGLDRPRRLLNVGGAFGYRGDPLAGRSVLLVDDVATTGATLDACAAALRAAGSGPVFGFTIARAQL